MKTLAIRLEDELHAQLTLVAQLENTTVTDLIRSAVMGHIERSRAELSNRADAALAEIERDAAARRQAITALFGSGEQARTAAEPSADTGTPPASRTTRRTGGAPN